jgi:flagellar biosynthetic protein FliR
MDILYSQILSFSLCFIRIVGVFLLTPIFSEKEFLTQAKVVLAALLALFILPLVENYLPHTSNMSYEMFLYQFFVQFSLGLLIGVSAHFIFMALDLIGHFIGTESGLSNAQTFNPSLGISAPLSTTLLTLGSTVLLFSCDFHHLIIQVLIHSFEVFDFSHANFVQDYHTIVLRGVSKMFAFGLQFSFPFIIIGFVMNMAVGLVNKLIPQIQIFSIIQPVQLLTGFALLILLIHPIVEGFVNLYKQIFLNLFNSSIF